MKTEPGVVIIIAAGRSGSKYLRGLLGASSSCAVVPYDVNFIWRYGNQAMTHDVMDPASLDRRHRDWIRRKIFRLSGWRRGSRATIVVEKSVSNALRVPFVRAVFPEARLLHLVRDGRAVAESARRIWHDRPTMQYSLSKLRYLPVRNIGYVLRYVRRNLGFGASRTSVRSWGPCYPGMQQDLEKLPLLDVCARQWMECVSRCRHDLSRVEADTVHTVRFEDLVVSREVLRGACQFAGIGDGSTIEAAWTNQSDAKNVDKWRAVLAADECRRLTMVMWNELLRYGYVEENDEESGSGSGCSGAAETQARP